MSSDNYQKLYDLMISKGYPEDFSMVIASEMHTDFTSMRMIGYISKNKRLPLEEAADETRARVDTDLDSYEASLEHWQRMGQDWLDTIDGALRRAEASPRSAKKILTEHDIVIRIAMGEGDASCVCWGCDITYEYIKINGDYRT